MATHPPGQAAHRKKGTGQIHEQVYAISSSMVSFYVWKSDDGLCCFDTGSSAVVAERGFAKLGLNPGDVTHVFMTHSDRDHVGGVAVFKGAKIFFSEAEKAMIDGTTLRSIAFFKRHNQFPGEYSVVQDRQKIVVGSSTVEAILTPGHTSGSTSYLVDEKFLFTGDLIALKKGRVRPSPGLLNNDTAEDERSIQRLAAIVSEAQMLCTGHSGSTTDYRYAMERYFSGESQ